MLDRFWAKVDKNGPVHPVLGTACWLWTASLNHYGYGQLKVGGAPRLAHQLSLEIAGRPLPAGLETDHLCRVRACVRPEHLEAVTRRVNFARSPITVDKVHRARTYCPRGHVYAGENLAVRPDGSRWCRDCNRSKCAARRSRLAEQGAALLKGGA